MIEWKEYKLGTLINSISKTYKFSNEKVCFLNTSDTLEGKVINHNYFDPKDLPGQAKKSIELNDILYSEIRPANKRYAFIDFNVEKYVVSTKLMVLRIIDSEVITPKYLYYFLTSDEIVQLLQMLAESRSGTFPQIRFEEISLLDIKLPPIDIQNSIVELISSIDEKIEVNNKINQELETLAQTLFKQWFVDFEFPNENGEPYKSSGGEMVDGELGEIPKGWEVGLLNKIASLDKGNVKPYENPEKQYFHYSLPDFDNGKKPSITNGKEILSSKYKITPFSILVSKLNPRIPRVWIITDCNENSICSTEFQVIKPKKIEYFSFICTLCSSNSFFDSLKSKVTGTSSSHQRVNPNDIINYKFPIPKEDNILTFDSIISDIFIKKNNNIIENSSLILMRDTLLPKLISGELEINEIKN